MKNIFFIVLIFLISVSSFAEELIVVHPSTVFDETQSAKEGIEEVLKSWKGETFLLKHDDRKDDYEMGKSYYIQDSLVDHVISSEDGENEISIEGNSVTLVGGFFYACQSRAVGHLMNKWYLKKKRSNQFSVDIVMSATYIRRGGTGTLEKCPAAAEINNYYYDIRERYDVGGIYTDSPQFSSEGYHHLIYRCKGELIQEWNANKGLPVFNLNLI